MDARRLYRRQYKLMVRGWKAGLRAARKRLAKIAGSYDVLRRRVGS
jgi:hypothetical protein